MLFNKIRPNKVDGACVSAIMNGLIINDNNEKAIELFDKYKEIINDVAILLYIKACVNLNELNNCNQFIQSLNLNNINRYSIELINSLLDYFGKTGDMDQAIRIFNNINDNNKDAVTIANIMNAYINSNQNENAIQIFESYITTRNDVTNLMYIKACMNIFDYKRCNGYVNTLDMTNVNEYGIEFINTLIDFHGKNGNMNLSVGIFKKIHKEKLNIASFSTIMNIYKSNKKYQKVIDLYFDMEQNMNLQLNDYIYSIVLYCCGELSRFKTGESIINSIKNDSILFNSPYIQSSIISMYAKCGYFKEAINVYHKISDIFKNNESSMLIIYPGILDCYAKMGDINQIISLYGDLKKKGIKLNEKIYCIILNACSHSGNMEQGILIFNEIKALYKDKMDPNVLTTVIDGLSRQNNIDEAFRIYKMYKDTMYYKFKLIMLSSMISMSFNHNRMDIGIIIFNEISSIYNENKLCDTAKEVYMGAKIFIDKIKK